MLVGIALVFCLTAATPTPVPEAEEPKLEDSALVKSLPDLLSEVLVIFSLPGFSVLLGNLMKFPALKKWLDGKMDKIVAGLTTILFGLAVYGDIFDVELLQKILPWINANLEDWLGYINIILGWVLSMISIPWFHDLLKGKFIVGRSFGEPE